MRVLHWFRNGLRLHDNPALLEMLVPPGKSSHDKIEPFFLYVLDSTGGEYGLKGHRQVQFLLESLIALDLSLSKMNKKFRLFFIEGDPLEVCLWKDLLIYFESKNSHWLDNVLIAEEKEIDYYRHTITVDLIPPRK